MTKHVAVLLSLAIAIQLCQSLTVFTSLTLPLGATTESLQAGCVDNNHNKGYSVLNTTSGASLIRFTLDPLSFQPEDYVFAKVSISKSNGALLDPRTQILYLYGYNDLGTMFGTIAAIESFDVSNGTNLNPLTSYVTLATDTAGFLSAFVRVSLGHVFTITTTNNSTTLYELDLQSTGPAEVIHQQALEAPVAGENYAYHTAVVLQTAVSGDSPQVQTDYVFGTSGTTPVNSAKLEVPDNLPPQVAARLKGMKNRMHFNNNQRETLNYDSPSVSGYSSAYPWPPSTSSTLTANTTLFSLASCKNSTDLIGLLATCDQDTGLCSSFSVISLTHSLALSDSIFVGNYNDVEPVTTLTCVPGQNVVLVTLGSTFYKVNMETSEVDKLALPSYKDLIWVGSDADGDYAYVGAEVYPSSSTGSVILQIQL